MKFIEAQETEVSLMNHLMQEKNWKCKTEERK